jgi:WXG100 family type VII secretion target
MVKFKVDLGELEKAAAMMNQQVQNYEKALKDLKTAIDTINTAWQGEDSVEFVNLLKIKWKIT